MLNKKIIILILIVLVLLIGAFIFWLVSTRPQSSTIVPTPLSKNTDDVSSLPTIQNNLATTRPDDFTVFIDELLATYQFFIGSDKESQSLLRQIENDVQINRLSYQINIIDNSVKATEIQQVFQACLKTDYHDQQLPMLCDCLQKQCYVGQSEIVSVLQSLTKQ